MEKKLTTAAIALLKSLIRTPSFSSEENETALLLEGWFRESGIPYHRNNNNVWAVSRNFDADKPTLLLNSHHDTVKPNHGYSRDPFLPEVEDGKLYGLGSNDAGGALVSLLATFTYFFEKTLPNYNLVFVASAEEESSGELGLKSMLPIIPDISVAIVGEPTLMQLAVAEKGLVVFDAKVKGTPGHAAHPNNDNAIYKCTKVLDWFERLQFEKSSDFLGDVKTTVTQINAGKHHNAVPAEVDLVIDVRVNDQYSNEEVADILKREAPCDWIEPRSLRLNSSSISLGHPLVKAGIAMGRNTYGSATLSDQSVLSCPSLKLGPGNTHRSHTADEFIYVAEIEEAITIYINLLKQVL